MTLREALIRDEDEVLHLYYDSRGVPSIGIGCNLRDVRVPQELCKHITITEEGSRLLFESRVADARADLGFHLPWALSLDESRQEVLINMIFNMGIGNLLEKNPKFLAATRRRNFDLAAHEMLDGPWKSQVGERAHRLAKQMRTGERQ